MRQVKVVKKGTRNNKQRFVVEVGSFRKHFSLPLELADKCIEELKQCSYVEEVNEVLEKYGLKTFPATPVSIESTIKKLLGQYQIPVQYSAEYDDLYQELFLKAWETVKAGYIDGMSDREAFSYLRTVLENHLKTLLKDINERYNSETAFELPETFDVVSSSFAISPTSNVNRSEFPIVKFPNPEYYTMVTELLEKLQLIDDEEAKTVLSLYLNPPTEIWERFQEEKQNNNRLKGETYIPITVFAKYCRDLGIIKAKDPKDKIYRILSKAKKFLEGRA